MWKIQGCFHFLQLFVFWIFLSHVNFRFEISMWVSHGSVWEWYYSPSGPVSQGFPVSSTRFQIPNEFIFFTSSFRLPIDHISIYNIISSHHPHPNSPFRLPKFWFCTIHIHVKPRRPGWAALKPWNQVCRPPWSSSDLDQGDPANGRWDKFCVWVSPKLLF